MIIEEADNCWPFEVVQGKCGDEDTLDMTYDDYQICVDKQQATQLIEVLTKWVNGVEVE